MFRKKVFARIYREAAAEGGDLGGASTTTGEGTGLDTLQANADGSMQATGSVATRLMSSGMRVAALRTNDVLRKDEWKEFDKAVVEVAKSRLLIVGDLIARGLQYSLTNALGTTILQWEQLNEMSDAEITMSGLAESENDRAVFTLKSLPVPLIHKDFHINIRALEASRRTGESLDTTQARQATRKVAEATEKMFVDGVTLTHGGGNIYGLTNHPSRNTGSLTSNWADTVNTTGEEIVTDVLKMIDALVSDNMYGPYNLYVPTSYFTRLSDDYKANSDRTIMERILAIPQIQAVIPSSFLAGGASGEVVMLQTTSDVIDVVDGIQPTPVMWDSHGGMVMNFKVLSIMLPRIKADVEGQCGVAHFSV